MVATADGDIGSEYEVRDIVRNRICPERTVKLKWGETLTLWHERTKKWDGLLDIEGGGYPCLFINQPYGW